MKEYKIPKGIKCKIIVDSSQGNYSARPGLLAEDHIRMAKDLEKIATMPLVNDHYEDNPERPVFLGIEGDKNYSVAYLPYRKVDVLCADSGNGRIIGYIIEDRVACISDFGGRTILESVNEWYDNSNTEWASGSYPHLVGLRNFTLTELDKIKK